jgi:hypothetical protein
MEVPSVEMSQAPSSVMSLVRELPIPNTGH